MKRNIKKLVAIGIGLSVMSSSIVPVFAAEVNQNNVIITNVQAISKQKKVLTLQTAVNAAIENSDKLSLKSKQIKLYRDKLKIQEKLDEINKDHIDEDFPYDKLELQKDQARQEKEFLEDQIENDITNKYNDLVLRGIEIDKITKTLEIKEKDIKNMELKKQLGLATSTQMKGAEIEIQNLKDNKKTKEDLLKIKKEYFGVLTDLNLDEYNLNHNIEYNPFRIDGSIDDYVNNKVEEYLKYNQEMIDLTSDYMDDMEDVVDKDPTKPEEVPPKKEDFKNEDGSYNKKEYEQALEDYNEERVKPLNMYGTYLEGKYNLSSSEVTLDESKKNLKNGLKESYSNLLDLENKINTTKQQVELTNKNLEFAKLQYDLGLTTLNDYNNQVLKSEDLNTSLRTLVNNYNILKNNIQKPWLLSNGSGNQR